MMAGTVQLGHPGLKGLTWHALEQVPRWKPCALWPKRTRTARWQPSRCVAVGKAEFLAAKPDVRPSAAFPVRAAFQD